MEIFIFCISFLLSFFLSEAAPPRDLILPKFQFDVYHIKTPQLIGIIFGCLVFTITIGTVIYLLYASGTLTRALQEMQTDSSYSSQVIKKEKEVYLPFQSQPELYDHLIQARTLLLKSFDFSDQISKNIKLRKVDVQKDKQVLFEISNGSPQFHESQYNPSQIWGWNDYFVLNNSSNDQLIEFYHPWESVKNMERFLSRADVLNFCIEDIEFGKPIGLIVLSENDPINLSINLETLWLTPAFFGSKKAHEAILVLFNSLFKLGYRRITAKVDERHIVARKFLQRCGFQLESILRKNKIIQNRNSNSSLYSMLNSEWIEFEPKFKLFLGFKPDKKKKEE